MTPKYVEFHEDSEFRHESSRNCDPRQKKQENQKHVLKQSGFLKGSEKTTLTLSPFGVFTGKLLSVTRMGGFKVANRGPRWSRIGRGAQVHAEARAK